MRVGAILLWASLVGVIRAEVPETLQARARGVREEGRVMRVLHFGDSHLVAPATRSAYGRYFHQCLGDGGKGLGLPWLSGAAQSSRGWRKVLRPGADPCTGLGGTFMEAGGPGEWARLEGEFSHLRLHLLRRPGAGTLRVRVDGRDLGELSLNGPGPSLALFQRDVPSGRHRLELETAGQGPVRLLGLALERGQGGTYSALAFNGAEASWMGKPSELILDQVRAESPDLILLAFGTNEANDPHLEPQAYRHWLDGFLSRMGGAAPGASMVLLGPPDGRLPRAHAGALAQVIAVQRSVASAHGALFLDQQAAMGGEGGMGAWQRAGLAGRDGVHLLPTGYRKLAGILAPGLLGGQVPGGRDEAPERPLASNTGGGLYMFRTADGRTIITDRSAAVAGLKGEWIGRKP
nr:GDSL-type esterase/lipase family protein [uncultured Holophaga sp.]